MALTLRGGGDVGTGDGSESSDLPELVSASSDSDGEGWGPWNGGGQGGQGAAAGGQGGGAGAAQGMDSDSVASDAGSGTGAASAIDWYEAGATQAQAQGGVGQATGEGGSAQEVAGASAGVQEADTSDVGAQRRWLPCQRCGSTDFYCACGVARQWCVQCGRHWRMCECAEEPEVEASRGGGSAGASTGADGGEHEGGGEQSGGGSEGAAGEGGEGPAGSVEAEGRRRFPPHAFLTPAGLASMDEQSAGWLAGYALWHYHKGGHPVPNVRTREGALRQMYGGKGRLARVGAFLRRETEVGRPGPRSAAVSLAQSAVARSVAVHGEHETVRALLLGCTLRAEAQTPTAREVRGWQEGS